MGKRKKTKTWIDDLFSRTGSSAFSAQRVGRRRAALEPEDSGVKVDVDARFVERRTFKRMFCRVEFRGKPEDFGVGFSFDDFESYWVDPFECPAREEIESFLSELLASLAGNLGEEHPDYIGTEGDVHRKRLRVRFEFGRIPEPIRS